LARSNRSAAMRRASAETGGRRSAAMVLRPGRVRRADVARPRRLYRFTTNAAAGTFIRTDSPLLYKCT
jgi:hypothetical protein